MKTFEELIKNESYKLQGRNLRFDEYENNKIDWLRDDDNNGYISEKTKITYYRLLDVHVHSLEVANNKDLRKFTSVEIENLIKESDFKEVKRIDKIPSPATLYIASK